MDEPRDLVATYAYVPPDLVLVHTQDQTERKQAQDALQKSEQELRSLYMGIPVPTYTWQKTADRLVLVDHNDADIQMGQAGLGDFLGMPAREILRNTPAICDTLWQCLDQEKSSSWEGLFQHPTTGEHRHLVLKCAYVPPDRVLVQTEDITERKKAEEALHRSRQETLRSRDILQALGQAAQAIQRSLTVEEVYESIGKQAERLGYRAFVLAVAEDRSHLVLSHASLKGAALPKAEKLLGMSTAGLRIPLVPDGFLGPLLSRGDSLYCQRTADLIFRGVPHLGRTLIQRLVAILGVERSIYAPLEIYGEIEGMLAIGGSDLEKVDVPAVTAFAIQAAIALEHARLLAQVRSIGERLRQLAHSTVSAQEEERRRLSRALHDDAGQDLTALGISLQLIRQDLPREARFLRPRLDDAASLASKTLDQLRLLARDLRPPALDAIGLDRALHELCRDFARRTGIAVEYHGSDCSALPEVVSISLGSCKRHSQTPRATLAPSTSTPLCPLMPRRPFW
jgi:signal transduction histidine kinase